MESGRENLDVQEPLRQHRRLRSQPDIMSSLGTNAIRACKHRRISSAFAVLSSSKNKLEADAEKSKKEDQRVRVEDPPKVPIIVPGARKRSIKEALEDPILAKTDGPQRPTDLSKDLDSQQASGEEDNYDEEDVDNPPIFMPGTANPLSLINEAMEKGPRTCVRRYKRSLMAANSVVGSNGPTPTNSNHKTSLIAPLETGEPSTSTTSQPPSKENTVQGSNETRRRNIGTTPDRIIWTDAQDMFPIHQAPDETLESQNVLVSNPQDEDFTR
ncbi:hypothetical protein Ciccas_000218 [Cichlidogyrus casuarinus]|uniref:Uncharacterized protein n=1 Tax=Cichlidogyrus casuarinus TaxID=1844966 RepID=A0ABD2QPN0_9PLAT